MLDSCTPVGLNNFGGSRRARLSVSSTSAICIFYCDLTWRCCHGEWVYYS